MRPVRIQRYLSIAGICSRRSGEKYIISGRVMVNGEIVSKPGIKVDPEKDDVRVDGKPLDLKHPLIYIVLNKPKGYITSCSHNGKRIVLDLVKVRFRIFPIGRLDKDSTGLLLLTNDGELHHQLSHPSFDHEKEYVVKVADPISDGDLERMEKGLPIMGKMTRPAKIHRLSQNSFRIILQEGKNRQIRRMAKLTGNVVTRLKRVRIANVRLGTLAEGEWRYLSEKEKNELLRYVRSNIKHDLI
jgi:23S rRNA pseudouridine2605 synthase/23S rRNA pseudouridine2604 synthase